MNEKGRGLENLKSYIYIYICVHTHLLTYLRRQNTIESVGIKPENNLDYKTKTIEGD